MVLIACGSTSVSPGTQTLDISGTELRKRLRLGQVSCADIPGVLLLTNVSPSPSPTGSATSLYLYFSSDLRCSHRHSQGWSESPEGELSASRQARLCS